MKVTPVKLKPYHVYRNCETGVSFYRYCLGNREIGSATVPVLRTGTAYLHGPLLELLCDVDWDMTVFPGATRNLYYADRETRSELHARIVYLETGHHSIHVYDKRYDVHYKDGKYYIYENNIPLAYITVNSFGKDLPVEPRMTMHVKTEISDSLAALLLSFPLLQIGM